MKINNILKSSLVLGLLIAVCPHNNAMDGGSIAGGGGNGDGPASVIATAILLAGGATATYFGFSWYNTHVYRLANKRYKVLNHFKNNPAYNYKKLTDDATAQYFDQCCPDSESIESDYPGIWIEKDTSSKKCWLGFIGMITFNAKMKKLAEKLMAPLKFLRKSDKFKEERKKFNKLMREKRHRDEKNSIQRAQLSAMLNPNRP